MRDRRLALLLVGAVAAAVGCGPRRGLGGDQVEEPSPPGGPAETTSAVDPGDVDEPGGGGVGWARAIAGSGQELAYGVEVGSDGSLVVAGWFDMSTDLDPGEGLDLRTSMGAGDAYVVKLDGDGNLLWARTVGGPDGVGFFGLTLGPDDSIFLLGSFVGTADFDPGPGDATRSSNGNRDVLVVKLDAAGAYVWAQTFGGPGEDGSWDAAVAPDGSLVAAGFFRESVDFGMGRSPDQRTTAGASDIFVVRLAADGSPVWTRTFGGVEADAGVGIGLGSDGSVYVTGSFQGTVDFDPGPATVERTAAGREDVFVLSLTGGGDFRWVAAFGSPELDLGWALTVGPDDRVYVTGSFSETVDFDPGPGENVLTSKGSTDLFVCALGSGGDHLWTRAFGTRGEEWGRSVAVAPDGTVLATGTGEPDVVALAPDGGYRWSRNLDAGADINCRGIAGIEDGSVVVSGGFYEGMSFHTGRETVRLDSGGSEDAFVVRFSP